MDGRAAYREAGNRTGKAARDIQLLVHGDHGKVLAPASRQPFLVSSSPAPVISCDISAIICAQPVFVSGRLCKAGLVINLAPLDADVIHHGYSAAPIFCPPRRVAIQGHTCLWRCAGAG
jgi:hypothetical protein